MNIEKAIIEFKNYTNKYLKHGKMMKIRLAMMKNRKKRNYKKSKIKKKWLHLNRKMMKIWVMTKTK